MVATYYADTSEFQIPYNSGYPYAVAMFRFHSGYMVDPHAAINWLYLRTSISEGRTRLVYAYAVFVPGQLAEVLAGLKQVFGPVCPTNRLVLVIDMESGSDFAGPGNHSAEANIWASAFQGWGAKVDPYANVGDYAACWPTLAPTLTRRHIARYSDTPPAGAYSWQYYGVTDDPSPVDAPRECAPFGAGVDMNVIYRSIEQIELDYGITAPIPNPPAPPEDDEDMANKDLYVVPRDPIAGTGAGYYVHYPNTGQYIGVAGDGPESDIQAFVNNGASPAQAISLQQHRNFMAAATNKSSASTSTDAPMSGWLYSGDQNYLVSTDCQSKLAISTDDYARLAARVDANGHPVYGTGLVLDPATLSAIPLTTMRRIDTDNQTTNPGESA